MSIRLRLTLLYSMILALTLAVFSVILYSIQSQTTLDDLKKDLHRSSNTFGSSLIRTYTEAHVADPQPSDAQSRDRQPSDPQMNNPWVPPEAPPPVPFENISNDQNIKNIPEREIVRLLDSEGNLVASPFGRNEDALPLSDSGFEALSMNQEWYEMDIVAEQHMLIYSRPIVTDGEMDFIVQVARPLTERDRSLQVLGTTLAVASFVTLLAAFGIGWLLSGLSLQPIHRITQTAQAIGKERDFTKRVDYAGPLDEVGQLATTINAMLSRLEDAYQQVAQSLEKQRNFVADISHELRTPLTTLRGNLGLLRRVPSIPSDERDDILSDMVHESERLIRLVNNLLVLARADVKRSFSNEQIAIRPLIDEICRQIHPIDPKRNIIIDVLPFLTIYADRDAFQQVLYILLDNAMKHSTGDIVLSATQNNTEVEIRVQDFGEGIDPDKLSHVFDRFYRGDDHSSSDGFGLGLSIAKSLMESQGRGIKIESEPGKGSQFILSFSVYE